ncbi:hypothetical protein Afil01_64800 [Actinorhabdospora filicis]|uniref:Uncharacterized protein n=1 Tax=Actinorhabdospora filicis TaxID=1785913 RepID=A0A9W6STA6_9ACTN|nr:hypothetical protein [Actinorhabdospora filicis]GLZ81673.1 hypothetical protein Afil01_64800 [Actinorhabdospora filicis]
MHPWHESGGGEPVIDLGAVDGESTWEPADTPAPRDRPPAQPSTRWVLVTVTIVLTAVATLASAVLFQRCTAPETPPAAAPPPNNAAELTRWVLSEAPAEFEGEVMLLSQLGGPPTGEVARVVAPGSYRLHMRCGMLGAQARRLTTSFDLQVSTTAGAYMVSMPCPSTVVRMEHVLTFTELGGLSLGGYLSAPEDAAPYVVAVWLVPEEGD